MKGIIFSCLCVLFLSGFPSQAQNSSGTLSERYARGKQLLSQAKYREAIDIFRPISRQEQGNPYVEYASFYFGLASFKGGEYDLAKNMFAQIKSKYPRWDKLNEVDFWLANAYFELGMHEQAIDLLKKVEQSRTSGNQVKNDIQAVKNYYLDRIATPVLQQLLASYPDDEIIARQLVRNIASTMYNVEEQALVDSLVNAFDIDMSSLGVVSKESSVKKEVYHVGVLLPFLYDNLNASSRQQGNQFVIDLYKGIKMAAEDLQQQGINLQIHAYDTERSFEKTSEILQKEEIQIMDMFIGPLYPGPYRAATEFALENQKYLFNPLSSNPAAIGENPFAYLMRPSLLTEGQAAARFAIDSLNRSQAVVLTSTSPQDSLRVSSFVNIFGEDPNRNLLVFKERDFSRERIEELVDTLNYMGEDNLVYVATGNELVISNIISAMVMAENKVPVIGSEEWLDINSITYDQLENFEEYLMAPGYINPENQNLEDFKDRYRQRYYDIPNKYTYAGYDLMIYVGNMLDRYGVYFQEFYSSQQTMINSLLYVGYDYWNANDNQVVPIIKFEESQLRLVNTRP